MHAWYDLSWTGVPMLCCESARSVVTRSLAPSGRRTPMITLPTEYRVFKGLYAAMHS